MEVIDMLETLVEKHLKSREFEISGYSHPGIGELGINSAHFNKNCYFRSFDKEGTIKIILCYKHYCKEQFIVKNSKEYSRYLNLILKIEDYILEQDELEFLTFLSN